MGKRYWRVNFFDFHGQIDAAVDCLIQFHGTVNTMSSQEPIQYIAREEQCRHFQLVLVVELAEVDHCLRTVDRLDVLLIRE